MGMWGSHSSRPQGHPFIPPGRPSNVMNQHSWKFLGRLWNAIFIVRLFQLFGRKHWKVIPVLLTFYHMQDLSNYPFSRGVQYINEIASYQVSWIEDRIINH